MITKAVLRQTLARLRSTLEVIAGTSSDPASRSLAAAAVAASAAASRPDASACLLCGTPTKGSRLFCSREHALQHRRQERDRRDPAVYGRYFEALRMRSEGESFAAVGRHFGVSQTRGCGLVWAAARVLACPENADRPEQALMRKVIDRVSSTSEG